MIDPNWWQDRQVLVAGHTGFKGAWLCMMLHRLGARVHGVALAPEGPRSLYADASVGRFLASENIIDLADLDAVRDVVNDVNPEIVFHFAAQSLVRRAHMEPVLTFRSNVLGTVHLLEALRDCLTLKSVLITTTDKVYFNQEHGRPFREFDRLGGYEPYAASKAATEFVVSAYRSSYLGRNGVAVNVARAGNVIGGGDWCADRIVPDIIRSVAADETLEIRSPAAVRPWQHVLDALAGYLLLVQLRREASVKAQNEPELAAWNFGPDVTEQMPTVGEICEIAQQFWPTKFRWRHAVDSSGVKESKLLLLDPARAMQELSWRPCFAVREALSETFKWYEAFLDGEDAAVLCRNAVDRYVSSAD
ncbi:MAG: CDP-glucose 4,6-dehydratase [Pseudomonadota bacterium]